MKALASLSRNPLVDQQPTDLSTTTKMEESALNLSVPKEAEAGERLVKRLVSAASSDETVNVEDSCSRKFDYVIFNLLCAIVLLLESLLYNIFYAYKYSWR